LHSDEDHQTPFVSGPNTQQIQDGGRHISPYLGRGLTDFDHIWHGDADWPSCAVRPLKIPNLKNQDGGGRHVEKSQKLECLGRSLTDFDQIWRGDAVRPS